MNQLWKKGISLLTFCAIMIGVCGAVAFASEGIYYYDNFDSETEMTWTYKGAASPHTVGSFEIPSATDKSYGIHKADTGKTAVMAEGKIPSAISADRVIMEFDMLASLTPGDKTGFFNLFAGGNNMTKSTTNLSAVVMEIGYKPEQSNNYNGIFTLRKGTARVALANRLDPEHWYRIKFAFNLANHTQSVFIDDTQVAADWPMFNSTVEDIGTIILDSTAQARDGKLLINNLKVYDESDAAAVAVTKASLELTDTDAISENITLPTEGVNGAVISWSSDMPDVLAADGTVHCGPKDTTVQLTALISKGEASETKVFTVTVLSDGSGSLTEEPNYFTDNFNNETKIKWTYKGAASPHTVGSFEIPSATDKSYGIHKADTSKTAVMAEGKIPSAISADSVIMEFDMLASLTPGDKTGFFNLFAGGNNMTKSTTNLSAVVMEIGYKPEQSNNYNGIFTLRKGTARVALANRLDPEHWYRIKFAFNLANHTQSVFIDDTQVAADWPMFSSAVEDIGTIILDSTAQARDGKLLINNLKIYENNDISAVYACADSLFIEDITGDFTLPTEGCGGTQIAWESEDADIVIEQEIARVTQPRYYESDKETALTAVISKGRAEKRISIPVVIRKAEMTDAEAVAEDIGALSVQNSAVEGFELPSLGGHETVITWSSDREDVIRLREENGAIFADVIRPEDDADVTVTLTATVTKNNASDKKEFKITVLHVFTDKRSVTEDAAAIVLEEIVEKDFTLPTAGANGSVISWQSSDASIIKIEDSDSGAASVTRQPDDVAVTLTATVTKGKETQTRSFSIVVKGDKEQYEQWLKEELEKLDIGNIYQITANLTLPAQAEHGFVILWQSSDTDIITDSGSITRGRNDSSVNLTATLKNGSVSGTKTFKVTVKGTSSGSSGSSGSSKGSGKKTGSTYKVSNEIEEEKQTEVDFTDLRELSVTLNGILLNFDQKPFIENGRTLVPVRAIAEAMGAEVTWDGVLKTVTISRGDKTVQLVIGSNEAVVSGEKILMDVSAKIVNERTMVPVRFLSDGLGAQISWDASHYAVRIIDLWNAEEKLQ